MHKEPRLTITIAGPRSAGKTWAALIIRNALARAGANVAMQASPQAKADSAPGQFIGRLRQLEQGFKPFPGSLINITEETTIKEN